MTLALERKKLLITRESSGKRLGRTDPSQETHFLFIFVSYLDSGGVLGWINTAVQELWVNSERAFFSATRTNHLGSVCEAASVGSDVQEPPRSRVRFVLSD